MDKEQEKWAIFWCDLLSPVIYGDIEAELTNQFLKATANEQIVFPDGRIGNPSLSTLRRKFNRYQQGGFDALARKGRSDRGKSRNIAADIIDKAIELKKDKTDQSVEDKLVIENLKKGISQKLKDPAVAKKAAMIIQQMLKQGSPKKK